MEDFGKLNDKLAEDLRCYVDMKVASVKLAVVEGLSNITGKAIGLVVCLFLCHIGLLFLIAALSYGLGLLIGSQVWAAVIVGVVCLFVGLLVFMRPGIFVNQMVRIYSRMFFEPRKKDDDE